MFLAQPIPALLATSALTRISRDMFYDAFAGIHRLGWFDWALLIPCLLYTSPHPGQRCKRMNLKRTVAIVLRQFYLFRGSPARILPMFAWVAIDIVLWGFITRYLNTVAAAGVNFVPAMLGAVLLWDFLVRVMQGITTTFFEDVWSRNFLNLFAKMCIRDSCGCA